MYEDLKAELNNVKKSLILLKQSEENDVTKTEECYNKIKDINHRLKIRRDKKRRVSS